MKTILLTALLALPALGQSYYHGSSSAAWQQNQNQQREIQRQQQQLDQQQRQIKRLREDYDYYCDPIVPLQPLRPPYYRTDPTPTPTRPAAVSPGYVSSQIQKIMANPNLSHAAKMRLTNYLLDASK